jgi:hypothetical protein
MRRQGWAPDLRALGRAQLLVVLTRLGRRLRLPGPTAGATVAWARTPAAPGRGGLSRLRPGSVRRWKPGLLGALALLAAAAVVPVGVTQALFTSSIQNGTNGFAAALPWMTSSLSASAAATDAST